MALAVAAGMADLPVHPELVVLGVGALFLLCLGLSFCVVAATHENRAVARFVHPVSYVMLPLSGCFLALQWLPPGVRGLFEWVPLSHVFELLRYGWFRSARPDYIDGWYLAGWIAGSWLVGLAGLAVLRRRIHMP
jgi:capsular polysaccharide transport system permease protein